MSCQLSIIVPVYNVVQYLRHCLQSLDQQGLDNYEVLLVNDASRDNSRGICAEWCASHTHFHLVNHDVNKGLSEARNTGLREAQGRFITFVDSDDYLEADTLKHVLQAFDDDTDIVEYPVMEHHFSKHPHHLTFLPQAMDFASWLRQNGHEHCYACNKVFRASLWKEENGQLRNSFPSGLHYEDILTIPYVLRQARSIRQTDKGMYYYCERPGSISNTPSAQNLMEYTNALNKLLQLPENQTNYKLRLRARNAELSYNRAAQTSQRIIHPRHLPLTYCLSSGLTLHDRLKALYYTCF